MGGVAAETGDYMSFLLSGYKWGGSAGGSDSGAVTVAANLDGLQFDTGAYTEDDFTEALNQAFNTWEAVAAVDFTFTSDVDNADIQLFADPLPGSTVGLAEIFFFTRSDFDLISSVDITFDSLEDWSPFGDPGTVDFYAVALHEIGHGIGLEHVNDTSEIMNPVIQASVIGDGDIDGGQDIYGTDPGDISVTPSFASLDANAPIDDAFNSALEKASSDPDDDDDDGGGGGGGFIALLLGGIAALLFGALGPGAAAGAALLAGRNDDEDDGEDLDEIVPMTGVLSEGMQVDIHHAYYCAGDADCTCDAHGHDHSHHHGHSHGDMT